METFTTLVAKYFTPMLIAAVLIHGVYHLRDSRIETSIQQRDVAAEALSALTGQIKNNQVSKQVNEVLTLAGRSDLKVAIIQEARTDETTPE